MQKCICFLVFGKCVFPTAYQVHINCISFAYPNFFQSADQTKNIVLNTTSTKSSAVQTTSHLSLLPCFLEHLEIMRCSFQMDWAKYVCYKPNEQYAGYMKCIPNYPDVFWDDVICMGRYTLLFGIHVTCTFVYALSDLWYALLCICSCA